MVHPIFTVLIAKPELVMEHVSGYASLMRDEASTVGREVAKRAVAWAVTVLSLEPARIWVWLDLLSPTPWKARPTGTFVVAWTVSLRNQRGSRYSKRWGRYSNGKASPSARPA